MPNILSNLVTNKDGKNKMLSFRYLVYLIVLFVIFVFAGFLIFGFFTSNKNNVNKLEDSSLNSKVAEKKDNYKGVITYVNPNFYPGDDISFYLADGAGEEIVLLKTGDQKLEVMEGHFVTVVGKLKQSDYGDYKYLDVDEVTIENVTD